jgi:CubicO group peptidase (beta-lactamase class C family)
MRRVIALGFCSPALIAVAVLIVGSPVAAQHHGHDAERDLRHADASSVGLSADRLERLDAAMQQMVDDGKLAGVVTMLARHGQTAFVDAAGVQSVGDETPMSADSIFLIYSMTKPITGLAMMMLYEEGRWRLNDPVSQHIPEFASLKVHNGVRDDGSPMLVESDRSMTMRDLMTHTAGFDYGGDDPVGRLYQEKNVLDADAPLQAMIDKLGTLPLRAQPGTSYYYSLSIDVQGYLVEQLSGQPFDEFLLTRIFQPLGMSNTAFFVPAGEVDRAARIHRADDAGALELTGQAVRTLPPAGPSGGGGLYSTAGDYLRFTQMFLNGGELDGVRLVSPRTVEMMRTNHLLAEPQRTMAPGRGWGLGFSVVTDAAAAGEPYPDGSYFWLGAAGTWFWIDPVNDLAFVGMIQHRGQAVREVQGLSRNLVYQALIR